MELKVSGDDIYVPETAIFRSFVGATGRVQTHVEPAYDDEQVEAVVRDEVGIRLDDAEITDVWIEEEEQCGEETVVTGGWKVAMSIPHTRSWSIDRVERECREALTGEIDVKTVEYGYSRPAYEYPTENWVDVTDGKEMHAGSGEIVEQWMHRHLLVIIGLFRFKDDDGDTFALARLAPPVPSPYEMATYWMYSMRDVAEVDMRRYMMSIDGAFERGKDEPVEVASERFSFAGERQEWDGPSKIVTEEMDDVTKTTMDSLPNRPLTGEEVDTVVDGYSSVMEGDCTVLRPEDPVLVDEVIRKARKFTEGKYVAFTVSSTDTVAVFELVESDDSGTGLRWVLKEGTLDV